MGRRIPSVDDRHLQSAHPVLSLSLFLAGMAAVVAITTTLCGYRFRKKLESKSSMSPPGEAAADNNSDSQSPRAAEAPETCSNQEAAALAPEEASQGKGLPLPPSKQLRETYSCNNFSAASISRRNLTKTMSMNLKRSISEAKKQDREEKKKKEKLKHEDSVWMKTIILGEKCKVPDEDEPEIYDWKGNKVSTYHPRTMSSFALSRNNSDTDHSTAIPSSQDGEKEVTANDQKHEEQIS